jgi:hypothetical protein
MFKPHSKNCVLYPYKTACNKCHHCCYNFTKYFTWLSSWYCVRELEIHKCQMTSRSRIVEQYLHSPMHLHRMILNQSQGKLCFFTSNSIMLIMKARLLIIIFPSYGSAWWSTIPSRFTRQRTSLCKFQRPVLYIVLCRVGVRQVESYLNMWKLLRNWESNSLSKMKNVSDECYTD